MHLFRRGDYSNSQKEPRHNARRQEPHQVSNRTRAQRLRLTGGAQGDHPLDIPVDAALHGYDDARSALDVADELNLANFFLDLEMPGMDGYTDAIAQESTALAS